VSAFPETRAAAGYAAAHGRGDPAGHRATVLLRRLRACEAALAGADGQMTAAVHGLLRGLVQAARDLAGPAWLAAHSDDPGIAAFTALEATLGLPAPAELDEIIAGALWARFAPDAAAREDGVRADGERGSSCRARAARSPGREHAGSLSAVRERHSGRHGEVAVTMQGDLAPGRRPR